MRRVEKDPCYIVYVDGGLCSQMQQYMQGKYLERRGFKVKYDLSFYRNYKGTGVNAREFVLLDLFGNLQFDLANRFEATKYRLLYPNRTTVRGDSSQYGNLPFIPMAPCYVGGHYHLGMMNCIDFQETFEFTIDEKRLGEQNLKYLELIKNSKHSVGVHVRRGDMAFSGGYWTVLEPEYYLNAIQQFDKTSDFFFFSDEPEWVTEKILPILPADTKCFLAPTGNDVTVDFYLMSQCNDYIASQGSMGKYVWLINKDSKLVLPIATCGKDCKNAWDYLGEKYDSNIIFVE